LLQHKHDVLLTQFNQINLEHLKIKDENSGLKEQKQFFVTQKIITPHNHDIIMCFYIHVLYISTERFLHSPQISH